MQITNIFFTLLATAATMVAAQDTITTGTTTSTFTLTRTVTITSCNPSVTYCPGRNTTTTTSSTSSSAWYPVSNSTTSAGPTAYTNTTVWVYPTSTPVQTTVVEVSPTTPSAPAATVTGSGAGSLFVQGGLLMSVVGAGIALLA